MQKAQKVAVVGAGVSGLSAVRLLEKLGAEVTLFDEKNGGMIADLALVNFDVVVLSPGFPRSRPPIVNALAKGVPVFNEIDIAAPFLPDCQFIGVTGTNGKSTTTAMIGDILKTQDPDAFVGGNLGRPLCDAVFDGEKPRFAVIELSSYQLETLSQLKLDVAVVTHLTPDHLDRYDSEEDYYKAKDRIFTLLKPGGHAVVNQKDPRSLRYLHPPQNKIDFNVALPFEVPKIVGAHNIENAAAALAATCVLGFEPADIEKALCNFGGLPHRLELLGTLKGVRWFNDSKATNVESSIIAVRSFEKGVHLILGGLGKGASYKPLVDICMGKVRCVYTIGEDAPVVEAAFDGHSEVVSAKTLDVAVDLAMKRTQDGDVILLAPACASYDQYKSYAERGEHLRQLFYAAGGKRDA